MLLKPRFRVAQTIPSIVFFLFFTSVFAVAQTPGVVTANGSVTINGKRVNQSGNIFAGETLKTGSGASATVAADGSVATLGSSVSLLYGDQKLELDCGHVEVVTIKGFSVQIHKLNVAPAANGLTKYEVSQNARVLSIHDLEGSIDINDGQQPIHLAAGEKRDFRSSAKCAAVISPLVPGIIFGASTFPIWPDYEGHPITPVKP